MRNIKLVSLAGIPLYVNPSWFLIFGMTTWLLAFRVFPDIVAGHSRTTYVAMATVSAIAFFASIVLHELAHSVVAKAYRIPVRSITLFLFGGVAHITKEATKPLAEILMAAAGPLTSLALGALLLGGWYLAGAETEAPAGITVFWLGWMNVILGVFNLVPAFPMDGGRVFRSAIWLISGSYDRATSIAGWTGRGFAWLLIGAGALAIMGFDLGPEFNTFNGVWFILIGLFLENGARQSLLQNRYLQTLRKYDASDLMVPNPPVVDLEMSVGALARGVLELNPRVCYFVEEHGALAGLVSAYQMRAIPEALWDQTTAGEAMVPKSALRATRPDRAVADVLLEMEQEDLLHMPVVAEGQVVGVIGRDRILGVLRQAGLLSQKA
jgi:Zn-dependent protease/CBS domain-containing protein